MWSRAEEWRINVLATYNWERSRGIMHTEEWQKTMSDEQEWFDRESRSRTLERHPDTIFVEATPVERHEPH